MRNSLKQTENIFIYKKELRPLCHETDYTIRTWDYTPIHYDDKGNPDSENIRYTLFKSVKDELGSHGEEVDEGIIPIYWDNEEV